MARTLSPPSRRGFTLVEMMVSTALIIFIMYILASAFEKGLTTFRKLKVAGDMQERLRTAANTLRSDLALPHFEKSDGTRQHVSDQRLDKTDWFPSNTTTANPGPKGYFRIDQGTPPGAAASGYAEGTDPDDGTLVYYRALPPTANPAAFPSLHFTIRMPGTRRDQYLATNHGFPAGIDNLNNWSQPDYTRFERHNAGAPLYASNNDNTFSTTWAEVTYFVQPTRDANGQPLTANGTPLYALYRRVKLLYVKNPTPAAGDPPERPQPFQAPDGDTSVLNLSLWKPPGSRRNCELNGIDQIAAPIRRFGVQQGTRGGVPDYAGATRTDTALRPTKDVYTSGSEQAGLDLLLDNVLDFQLKALWDPAVDDPPGGKQFAQVNRTTPNANQNPEYPFDWLPAIDRINADLQRRRVFDTWSAEDEPAPGARYRYTDPVNPMNGMPLNVASGPNDVDDANWNKGHFTTNGNGVGVAESVPLRVRMRALQIKIRIWDLKSEQSRQITIIQDL